MRLQVAKGLSGCKLWVTRRELDVMREVALTGDPLILPDHVVQHLKDHGHAAVASFPVRYPAAPLLGLGVHVEQDQQGCDL